VVHHALVHRRQQQGVSQRSGKYSYKSLKYSIEANFEESIFKSQVSVGFGILIHVQWWGHH
jgi:hypothetical protein